MPSTDPLAGRAPFPRPSSEILLRQFEERWRRGTPPSIDEFLALDIAPSKDAFRELLEELIKIDLAYRWRAPEAGRDSEAGISDQGSGGRPWKRGRVTARSRDKRTASAKRTAAPPVGGLADCPRLEDYLKRYPALAREVSLDLIAEEYRVRHEWGDQPRHDEYTRRFAQYGAKLRETLARVDAALNAEGVRPRRAGMSPPVAYAPGSPPMHHDSQPAPSSLSVQALLDALRQHRLLNVNQLNALLLDDLQGGGSDPRALARQLIDRGWLTPYQVNQLLQGQGQHLRIGPYLLLERLGEGGTGQVFKARHEKMNRMTALKVIRKDLLADAEVVGRFYREIEVLSRLDHPNVVHAYDAGPAGNTHFLAMEYVEGTDLGKLVKQGGPLPMLQACAYIRQAALGLQHAHERGLVHRDIKPHNLIMSVRDGLIKVADLGLARLPRAMNEEATAALTGASSSSSLTPVGAIMMGTVDYLAPEQALDFHKADIRADIYSLGCTFNYLLTSRPPFAGGTLAEKLLKHQQADPPDVAHVPKPVSAMLRKMLAKRPEERYQTPAAVAEALGQIVGAPTVAATGVATGPMTARRPRRRSWKISAVGGLLLLGLVTVSAMLLIGPGAQPTDPHASSHGMVLQPTGKSESPLDRLDPKNIPPEERWEGQPKELVAVLGKRQPKGQEGLIHVAFAPDDSLIATGIVPYGRVQLWDAATAQKRNDWLAHPGGVTYLTFTSNANHLVTGGMDRRVQVWDVRTVRSILPAFDPRDIGDAIAVSPDGKLLAAGNERRILLWELPSGKKLPALDGHMSGVHSLIFSPDNKTLFSAAFDQTIKAWDLPSDRERFTLKAVVPGHGQHVLALSADAKLLAAGEIRQSDMWGSTATLWNAATGQERRVVREPAKLVYIGPLAFTPDGSRLVAGNYDQANGGLVVWAVNSGRKLHEFPLRRPIKDIALARDGRHIAVGNADGTAYILRLAPGK